MIKEKDLGLLAGVVIGDTPPSNVNQLWWDITNPDMPYLKSAQINSSYSIDDRRRWHSIVQGTLGLVNAGDGAGVVYKGMKNLYAHIRSIAPGDNSVSITTDRSGNQMILSQIPFFMIYPWSVYLSWGKSSLGSIMVNTNSSHNWYLQRYDSTLNDWINVTDTWWAANVTDIQINEPAPNSNGEYMGLGYGNIVFETLHDRVNQGNANPLMLRVHLDSGNSFDNQIVYVLQLGNGHMEYIDGTVEPRWLDPLQPGPFPLAVNIYLTSELQILNAQTSYQHTWFFNNVYEGTTVSIWAEPVNGFEIWTLDDLNNEVLLNQYQFVVGPGSTFRRDNCKFIYKQTRNYFNGYIYPTTGYPIPNKNIDIIIDYFNAGVTQTIHCDDNDRFYFNPQYSDFKIYVNPTQFYGFRAHYRLNLHDPWSTAIQTFFDYNNPLNTPVDDFGIRMIL